MPIAPGQKRRISVEAKGLEGIHQALSQFPAIYAGDAREVFRKELLDLQGRMQERSKTGPLFEYTGKLAKSWAFALAGTGLSDLEASAFSYSGYSIIHEQGLRVVAPKNAWLYIPIRQNRDARGHPLNTPAQVMSAGGKFGRFWDQGRKKTGLISGFGEPMFVAVKSAQHKPRLGFFGVEGPVTTARLPGKLADQMVKTFMTIGA